ncbi:hypothetical protein ACVW16_000136 [Bradyrhizobium sp. USDA 4474]
MHKSLRSSPLRGSKSRQGCSRWRGQRCRGGRSTRLTGGIKRGPAPRCGSHTGPLYGMTKIALTKAPTSLLECAVDIPARKKLIQTMPLDIDRPINRAVVLGCAISATRNYLKLHRSQTLKILFCNTRAETRKLWKRSAWLPPLEAMPVDRFTGCPLLHFTHLPRYPLHSPRFPGMQRYTPPRARVALAIERGTRHAILTALAAPPAPYLP